MPPKGEATRRAILDQALRLASTDGLGHLTIGNLADAASMSKSGLFAHFRSKEQLQLAVLQETSERFVRKVLAPALRELRGERRLRALFSNWMRWEKDEFPGGCVFQAAATELDDQAGPVRDFLVETQRDLFGTLVTVVRQGVEAGSLHEEVDPEQAAFEVLSIMLGYQRMHRLLRARGAERRARGAFDALVERLRA